MVTTRDVEYTADGSTMVGRLALPDGGEARPGVVIAHEGGGLDDYQKDRAVRFAELGYVAFALDYHGGGMALADQSDIAARCRELWEDPERLWARAAAGLDVLLAESRTDASRVAAVGYCFGGALVLELARGGADIAAVVGFHPRLATARRREVDRDIKAKILVCVGTEDPLISAEERFGFEEEMRRAAADWSMILYGRAEHSFTNPYYGNAGLPGITYDQRADERSWRAMLDLFDETLSR